MPSNPVCLRTKNTAFINPAHATAEELEAAQFMCDACPLRSDCAREALQAGDTTDQGHRAPASGVFQAGVRCHGDYETAVKLALVAGVQVPEHLVESRTRVQAPDRCRECGKRMVRWHRGITPDGYVMHFARGFCCECRGAYRKWQAENPSRRRRVGSIDRSRRSAPSRVNRVVDVQLSLFDTPQVAH